MRTIRVYLKILSVVLILGAATVAWGRELLSSAFDRPLPKSHERIEFVTQRDNSAIAKLESKILDKCTKDAEARENKELPFLTNCIKYNCIKSGRYVCFYNSNQRMLYDALSERCLYFCYDCEIGLCMLLEGECEEVARGSIAEAFENEKKPEIEFLEAVFKNEKVMVFNIRTSATGEALIRVGVRRDTGSVILYDAIMCEKEGIRGEIKVG